MTEGADRARVLVVDDDRLQRELVRDVLADRAEVETCADADAALARALPRPGGPDPLRPEHARALGPRAAPGRAARLPGHGLRARDGELLRGERGRGAAHGRHRLSREAGARRRPDPRARARARPAAPVHGEPPAPGRARALSVLPPAVGLPRARGPVRDGPRPVVARPRAAARLRALPPRRAARLGRLPRARPGGVGRAGAAGRPAREAARPARRRAPPRDAAASCTSCCTGSASRRASCS